MSFQCNTFWIQKWKHFIYAVTNRTKYLFKNWWVGFTDSNLIFLIGWLGFFGGREGSVPYKPLTLNLHRHNCHLSLSMTKQNLFLHRTLEKQSLLRLGTIYAVCILIVTNIVIGNWFLNQLEHKYQLVFYFRFIMVARQKTGAWNYISFILILCITESIEWVSGVRLKDLLIKN